MSRFLSLLTLSVILFSCSGTPEKQPAAIPEPVISEKNKTKSDSAPVAKKTFQPGMLYQKSYEGILPCPDCRGIKTTFRVAKDLQTYALTEEYLGKKLPALTTTGNLNTERGFENDKNATVYILNHDQPTENQRYFVRETGKAGQLIMLNAERQKIKSNTVYVLKEVK